MGLKDFLDKRRNAVLEEERKQAEAERQRQQAQLEAERQRQQAEAQRLADEAVAPHPLRGRSADLLDDYVLGQLVLRSEGRTLDEAGSLLRPFAVSLGIPLEHFNDLVEEVSFYDEQSNDETIQKLCGELKESEEIICFLGDLAKLHGETYTLEGDFLELWRSICMGLFLIGSEEMALLERFCARIANGDKLMRGDDFRDIPQGLIQYYLQAHHVVGDGKYLVIDLSDGANASRYPVRSTDELPNLRGIASHTTELWLRRIKAGRFMMGSPDKELEKHLVTLTRDYYIGVFPCTQRQYVLVMGHNPSHFKGNDRPVECVSYDALRGTDLGSKWPSGSGVDADSFFGLIQARTGLPFDLPTEAEWEYACRAGTMTALNSGYNLTSPDRCPNLNAIGWYYGNADGITHPVGQKQPNAWGLYDMHGNVSEWCLDWYGDYPMAGVTDPLGATADGDRVLRGGNWCSSTRFCSAYYRNFGKPSNATTFTGFRVSLRS